MDNSKKIRIALRITFLLGIWAIICLFSESNRWFFKKSIDKGIEWVTIRNSNYLSFFDE